MEWQIKLIVIDWGKEWQEDGNEINEVGIK